MGKIDENVLLEFKSTKFKSGGEDETYCTCRTEILHTGIIGYYNNDWSRGLTEAWGHQRWDDSYNGIQDHNFLGSCAKEFRPYDQLEFQVVLPSENEHTLIFDDLEICYLTVTFGDPYWNQTESSMWKCPRRGPGNRDVRYAKYITYQ